MKKIILLLLLIVLILGITIPLIKMKSSNRNTEKEPGKYPNTWFMTQRIYPKDPSKMEDMMKTILAESKRQKLMHRRDNIYWISRGPYNISGRITDIEGANGNFDTLYIGSASGGVYKSVDSGHTFNPIFDENAVLPIGDIAVDPLHHNTVYVGTGEANASSYSYPGNGIYKSTDGGQTWQNLGLINSYSIGRIAINPIAPDTIFVAATGRLFGKDSSRGIYRSVNGGQTWQKVLYISDSTSGIDVAINPLSPDTVYAAMWERIRTLDKRKSGGVTSGIYRSENAGETWEKLTDGLPDSTSKPGRIGIAISKNNPSVIYAVYTDSSGGIGGVYRSFDNGNIWEYKSMPDIYNTYGWYFGNIRVSPTDSDRIFILGIECYMSNNGGNNWTEVLTNAHVDFHAMYLPDTDPSMCFVGSDGGFYISSDSGNYQYFSPFISNMQFYQGCVDPSNIDRLYGGAQDNGTNRMGENNPYTWEHIFGGDGFFVAVDPTDSNTIYAEYQWGQLYRSDDYSLSGWTYLSGDFNGDRTNWSTPYIIAPENHTKLYLGTYRLYRSLDRGDSWTVLTGDLTNGGNESSITTVAISPVDSNIIYVGTSDGNLWVSTNYGTSFSNVSSSLPNRWITSVIPSNTSPDTVIVTLSGLRWDDNAPHIMLSENKGVSWQDISGNLPDLPVNDAVFDKNVSNRLFVANDGGVLYTNNFMNYTPLGADLPPVPVMDIDIDNSGDYIFAFTYGRGSYQADISTLGIKGKNTDVHGDNIQIREYSSIFETTPFVEFSYGVRREGEITVLDLSGRTLARKDVVIRKGNNRFSINLPPEITSGTYFMTIRAGTTFKKLKITKIK